MCISPPCAMCHISDPRHRAQSRDLPGNQAPSDGGATRLSDSDATALTGEGPSVRDYLEFGRLLGERPDTVKQRLEAAGGYPASDVDAEDYLRQCVARRVATLAAGWLPCQDPADTNLLTRQLRYAPASPNSGRA